MDYDKGERGAFVLECRFPPMELLSITILKSFSMQTSHGTWYQSKLPSDT